MNIRDPSVPRVVNEAQDPCERCKNWDQVEHGVTPEQAIAESWRCLQEPAKRCESGCPVNVPIQQIVSFVNRGWWQKADDLFRQSNLLLGITSLVCPQSEQCEAKCTIFHEKTPAVAIGLIERAVYEWEQAHGGPKVPALAPFNGKIVAVVGSGPAAWSCAANLRVLGYRVVIFEAMHFAGGVLKYGIPKIRLPDEIVENEINFILSFGGIELVLNTDIGKALTVKQIDKEFDAIFFATGAGAPISLGIPGEDAVGVMSANQWLISENVFRGIVQIPTFKEIAVFGGGNVAMDSVRIGQRVLSQSLQDRFAARIVYRRSEEEMPARVQERHHAKEEGVEFNNLISPVRIISENGRVVGVECVKNVLGEPDERGRKKPVEVSGSNFILPADLVVTALGNKPNPAVIEQMGVETKRGYVVINESGQTSNPKFFSGGDLRGGGTVIEATGDGKRAAFGIHKYLSQK